MTIAYLIICKREKYKNLIKDLKSDYSSVNFIHCYSLSLLLVIVYSLLFIHSLLNDIGIDERQQRYNQKNDQFCNRATYYIFCCRNKNWDNPELLKFR